MTTQTVNIDAYAYAGTLSAKLRNPDNLSSLIATASSVAASGVVASRIICTFSPTLVAAGDYYLEFIVNGTSYSQYVTLIGSDGEVALARNERVAAASQASVDALGLGTGARTVTITVNDGSTVLQNARVRLTEGANTYTGLSNASGVVTFNLDDATYAVAITKSGYSYAGTTLVVDGTETATYSMTVVSITPPSDPALCAVEFHLRDQYGDDQAGEPVEITFVKWEAAAAGTPPVVSVPPVQETNASGLVSVNLYRNATYKIVYGAADYARRIDVVIPDAGSYSVEI